MKKLLIAAIGALFLQAAWGQGAKSGKVDDSVPDAEKIRFCERVRDQAQQAFYNRERGNPMKLYAEDGSNGTRVTNVVIRRIYQEPQISSVRKAEEFGRATCHELMGTKLPPE